MDRTQRNILLGAVVGALIGAAVAYYIDQTSEEVDGLEASRNPVDWLRFGVATLALGRQFANLLAPANE